MDYLMGIDLGSTSLKAVIYDTDGCLIASGSRPTLKDNTDKKHPERVVWQPGQIWNGTAEAIQEAVSRIKDSSQVKGVAVTGMGMDGVPVDEKGDWLYPFISWHDTRTTPQLEWWIENIGAERTYRTTGFPLWAINSAMRILWMKENEPEIMKRAVKWLLIEDFLNFKLTGNQVTDYSMASCFQLLDQKSLSWSDKMIKASGIEKELLPDVKSSSTLIGEITDEAAEKTGLANGTPVFLGGHDHICGALPAGVIKPGLVLDITGTWESVMTAVDRPVLTEKIRKAGITMQAHVVNRMHVAWGGAVAGESVEWFRREFGQEAKAKAEKEGGVDWDYLMAEAREAKPGAGGVFFLPHLSAAGCPIEDPRSLGAFAGLSSMNTKGDMLRAVFEGLNYQFLDIVTALESGLDRKFTTVRAAGGAVNNEFWMQNKADVVGLDIEVPDIKEATPLGAAILAGIGLGIYKDAEDGFNRVYRQGKVFHPNEKTAVIYEKGYQIYKELYPALKNVSHSIFTLHKK